ncbi:hypothetical protein D3C71_2191730 [compost metagenome]
MNATNLLIHNEIKRGGGNKNNGEILRLVAFLRASQRMELYALSWQTKMKINVIIAAVNQ